MQLIAHRGIWNKKVKDNSYEALKCGLLSNKYIKKDLRNPLTDKKMSDDTKSFIEIKWKDGKMICTHKEG